MLKKESTGLEYCSYSDTVHPHVNSNMGGCGESKWVHFIYSIILYVFLENREELVIDLDDACGR
jgi:thiosulfate reductase cytochrome b subunit